MCVLRYRVVVYKNIEDRRACSRRHYARHRVVYKERAKRARNANRERNAIFIHEFLQRHPCIDCGTTDVLVLTFDHVRGEKRATISNLAHNCASLLSLTDEIAKCEVRCFNCHARRTAAVQGWSKLVLSELEARERKPCDD